MARTWRRLVWCVVALSLASCLPARSVERSAARAAVFSLAQCVRLVALGCTARMVDLDDKGQTPKAVELGTRCEAGLNGAKAAIIAASVAVDNWDSPEEGGRFACSVHIATGALSGLMVASGANIPAVSQAIAFAKPFGNRCSIQAPKDVGTQ